VDVTAGIDRKETVMGDHEYGPSGAELLLDARLAAELDRLILRFEGLLEVCKLLEQRGATEAELAEHRREFELVSRRLASLVARGGRRRAGRVAA
jgi:hypothetical protein